MRLRKFCSLLLVLFLSCVISFSVVSPVKVSAAVITLPNDGHYMSVSDTLSFIGSSIQVEYATSSGTATASAIYDSSASFYDWSEWNENPVGFVIGNSNTLWLKYTISVPGLSLNPSEITCHIEPTYSIFDTEYIYTAFALSSAGGIDASNYSAPNSHWYIGGSISNFTNNSLNMSGGWQRANLAMSTSSVTYIPIVATSSSAFSAYSIDCNFYGNSAGGSGVYSFYVMCPYVSGRASMESGTFVTGSGSSGTDITVDVDVDLTETNGLLESIKNGISGIGQTILGLFVPDDEFMENWIDDMQDLLHDHLGGLYEAVAELEDFWQQFENVQAKSVIHIGECRLPLAGSELVLGNWDVPLKPTGIPQVLYTSLALIIDFLAVMAFLRMCRNKLEIILNPNSEVVKE